MAEAGHRAWRQRLAIAAVILVLAFATVAVAYAAFKSLAHDLGHAARQDLIASLSLRSEQIEGTLAEHKRSAALFATRGSVQLQLDPDSTEDARATSRTITEHTIADFKRLFQYDNIILLDTEMHPVTGVGQALTHRAEITGVGQALVTGEIQLIDLHIETNQRASFGIAVPVRPRHRPGAAPIGVAYLELGTAGPTSALVNPWASSHGSLELALLRRNGLSVDIMSLARDRGNPLWRVSSLSLQATTHVAVAALLDPSGELLEAVDEHNHPVIAVAAAVTGTPWVLLAKIDRAEIDAPVRQLGRNIAALVGGLLGVLFLFGVLLWRDDHHRHILAEAMLARRYASAISGMQDGFLRIDPTGCIVDANEAVTVMTGYSRDELLALSLADLAAPGTVISEAVGPGTRRFQTTWATRAGRLIDIDGSGTFVSEGAAGHTYIIARDITVQLTEQRRLERLNRFHGLINHIYQIIQRLTDPQEILREICTDLVVSSRIALVWAGWVDHAAGRVVPIAASGVASDYIRDLEITLDPSLPTSHGPTGRAVLEGRIVVSQFMRQDPDTAPWRAKAEPWGFGSVICMPIVVNGQPIAVLSIYSSETGHFDDQVLDLFRGMGETISVAIEAAEGRRAAERLERLHATNEERLRRILQALPVPMMVHSARSDEIRSVNAAFEALFGYDPARTLTVSRWLDEACIDADERALYRELRAPSIARADAGGAPVRLPELRLRGRDGTERVVLPHLSRADDEELLAWTDITETRAQQQALRRREDIYTAIVDRSIDSIALIRAADGTFAEFNTAAHTSLGYTRAEFAALRVRDIDPDFNDSYIARHVAALPPGGGTVFERVNRRRDGALRDVRLSLSRITVGDEDYFAVIWSDITEDRRRVRAAAAEGEKHRILFDSAADGIAVVGADARIVEANPAMLAMAGATADQFIGTLTWQWSANTEEHARWQSAHDNLRLGIRVNHRLRRQDGTEFEAELMWNKAEFDGETLYYVTVTISPTGSAPSRSCAAPSASPSSASSPAVSRTTSTTCSP